MSDSDDNWPSPAYYVGPPKHLHAFGVLSAAYNAFDDGMFRLCMHHLEFLKLPHNLAEFFYLSLNEHQRLEAIEKVFVHCEKDPNVVALVKNLIKYFDWCSDVRNKLAHAESYPAAFGGKAGHWHLSKRRSKKDANRGYMALKLDALREMADKVERGIRHCALIQLCLRVRDIPLSQLPSAYADYADAPLPELLIIPEKLELSSCP